VECGGSPPLHPLDQRAQVAAVNQRHREVGDTRVFATLENRHDVRMIEPSERVRRAQEAFALGGVGYRKADHRL
jgi:hypothetical protein